MSVFTPKVPINAVVPSADSDTDCPNWSYEAPRVGQGGRRGRARRPRSFARDLEHIGRTSESVHTYSAGYPVVPSADSATEPPNTTSKASPKFVRVAVGVEVVAHDPSLKTWIRRPHHRTHHRHADVGGPDQLGVPSADSATEEPNSAGCVRAELVRMAVGVEVVAHDPSLRRCTRKPHRRPSLGRELQ